MARSTAMVRTTEGVMPAPGILATMVLAGGMLTATHHVKELLPIQHLGPTFFFSTVKQLTVHQKNLSTSPVIAKSDVFPSISIAEASLRSEIRKYESLEPGWDGYGAEPASKEALGDLLRFLDKLPAGIDFPKVTLASSGFPSLYWDTCDFFADLEFSEGSEVSLFTTVKRGGEEIYYPFSSVEQAVDKISGFLISRSV